MTDQVPEEAQAEQAEQPQADQPEPVEDKLVTEESDAEKAARLRAEAAAIELTLPPPPGTVRMKVEDPHASFHFGGTGVGNDWTPVPEALASGLMQAAAEAGVTLTQEG
jgi:hypothetical protein